MARAKRNPEFFVSKTEATNSSDQNEERVENQDQIAETQKDSGTEKREMNFEEDLEQSTLSEVYKFFRKKIIPGVLEGGETAWKIFNKGVDFAANAVNHVVPAVTETVVGFVVPENFGRIINKSVEAGTKAVTFVGKNAAKISANVFTFGAPAWIDAFRQGYAVKEANEDFKNIESGQELTAVSYLEHLKDEKTKNDLNKYYELRSKLAELREKPEKNQDKIKEAAEKIALFEIDYKDNLDFANLKAILEKGNEFISSNDALIEKLAEETADKMIANVENYYQNGLGGLAGKVEGKWLNLITSPEQGRAKLVAAIAERLKTVMSGEMASKEVKDEMNKINKELFSAFGVYRKFMKASIYLILREMPLIKEGLEQAGVWEPLSKVAHQGYESVSGFIGEGAKRALSWLGSAVGDEISKAVSYVSEGLKNLISEAMKASLEEIKNMLQSIMHTLSVENIKDAAVSNTLENLAAAARAAGEIPSLSSPGAVPDITGILK